MSKNVLNEVNTIREQMGLPLLTEVQLIEREILKMDPESLNEGWWENFKGQLAKLGSYKKGGVALAKLKTKGWNPKNWELQTRWGVTKDAEEKIKQILDKKGNEVIKQLDASIKKQSPKFPNNTSQLEFLNIVTEIATVYDSLVAASKLDPEKEGYLPAEAVNVIIDDLRFYVQKYLDYDLSAAFSVFNEEEEVVETIDEASNPEQQAAIAISKKDENLEEEVVDEADADVDATKSKLAGKFADTKAAIQKGELKAYDTERMKTLKSWRLPAALLGAGATFGALSWVIEYMFPPEKVTTLTPQVVKETAEKVLGNVQPNDGVTQTMNALLGTRLTPQSPIKDFVDGLAKLGGGDPVKGAEIMSLKGGILKTPAEAKPVLLEIVQNHTDPNWVKSHGGGTLKGLFVNKWAGTGKIVGDVLGTVRGGTLVGMVVNAFTVWTAKTTVIQSAKVALAKTVLGGLGILSVAGAVTVALARYKGRKSSRAQILNDLVQYLRPVIIGDENPIDPDNTGNDDGQGGGNGQDGGKTGSDNQLYNYLKKYFQDLYNFRSQVNTDTYGKGGSGNAQKTYTGGGSVNKNLVAPNDASDLLKLMEEFEMVSEETLNDIGLSSNQLKLFKTNLQRLTQLIKMVNKFSSQDPNLAKMIGAAKTNPVSTADINSMLESDAKSLKIFVSDFNKALYSIQFKNGNSIIDQLGKIQVNKLQEDEVVDERAEREQPKGAMNKIYNDRRAFLGNLQGYVKTLYSIFSYLIDKMKSNPDGNKDAQADYLTGQKGGKNSPGLTSTDKTQMNKGLNNANKDSSASNFYRGGSSLRDVGKTLEEGKRYTKEELSEMSVDMEEALNPKMEAMLNSVNGKIFTQLAKVVPELSTRIATAYQQEYGEAINKARLGKFLETVLGALATVPQGRMVQMINRGDVDLSAYKRMLKDLKNMEGEDGEQPVQPTTVSFNPSSPEKFLPPRVDNYDLAGQKNSFRIGLAQKAAEIISRNNDIKLDEKNMLTVMKQLIDNLNSKHGAEIPEVQ